MLNNHYINNSLWLLFIILCFGCSNKNQNEAKLDELIIDSVFLPFKLSDNVFNGINSNYKTNEQLEYYNSNSGKLTLFSLKHPIISETLSLKKYTAILADYFIKTKDSIYIVTTTNFIYLVVKDKVVKEWDLNPIVKTIDTFSFCANLGPTNLSVSSDTIFIDLSSARERNSFSTPPQEFYRYGYKILVDITTSKPKLISSFNPYPLSFQKQDYYSFYQGSLTKNYDVIYSFNYVDSIYKYNLLTKKRTALKIKSNYFKANIPVKYDSLFDYKYLNNYEITQSRISLFFYNPSKHLIYLFIKHPSRPIENDGTINEYYDCPFSLVIISEDFAQQKEFYIPPNYIDKQYLAFCSKDFLYLPADENKQKRKGNTLYYKLNFSF
jgi:hypothetical protein